MKVASTIVIVVALGCSHEKPASDRAQAPAGPIYSCFTYSSGDPSQQHATCTVTRDCETVNQQVKGMGGMTNVTSCTATASVWCYHQGSQAGTAGGDVCQPSAEDCATMRKDAAAAKQPVDGDCAPR